MRRLFATAALALAVSTIQADARPHRHRHHHHHWSRGYAVQPGQPAECRGIAWCGCWLRLRLGLHDPARRLDLAAAWYGVGRRLSTCAVGAIAVWPHHVGLVTGCPGAGLIQMISGNDGHAVRDRVRPVRGAQFRAL